MSSRDTSTTTVAPSKFDESKAETIRQLRGLLFPAMTPQLSGAMTSQSEQGLMAESQKGINTAAGAGLESGTESLISMMGSGKGDKSNALNMALQLYGYQPMTNPSSTTKGSGPNAGAKAGAGINMAKSAYGLGKEMYEWYNKPEYTPFEYQPLETPTMNPNVTPTTNPYELPQYNFNMAPLGTASAFGGSTAAATTAASAAATAAEGASFSEILALLFL